MDCWTSELSTDPNGMHIVNTANISKCMQDTHTQDVRAFHQWSVAHYRDFWAYMVKTLKVVLKQDFKVVCDLSQSVESPRWLSGALMNISDSCLTAPSSRTAIVYQDREGRLHTMTYGELKMLTQRIANSLLKQGLKANDAIAIAMPMNEYAVPAYLGIIMMGGVVVSIADSFSSEEIAVRLAIADTKAIITQDVIYWGGKALALYQKVCHAQAAKIIVVQSDERTALTLREQDCTWQDFLEKNAEFTSVACDPMAPCNILFSSGTTAAPKAIPWNHTTPIKAASDAYLHQNIQANDVLAWPTNLGWMMGPWLIFAALINQATIALYPEAAKDRGFGEFVSKAKVTMLGLVPTLVATWRQSKCMEGLDWSAIKVFSSSGECSNPDDMAYLMALACGKPVIEYCGGTEIGGAYISSTVVQENYPSLFSTPAMGMDFVILDEEGKLADTGEVAIIPPSMGLSTQLLNADHHHVYFEGMPTIDGRILRRHGDQIKRLANGYYSILGRADDTMKLGGIKTSAAEIERTIAGVQEVIEAAAISISPKNGGPSQLIVCIAAPANIDKIAIKQEMQRRINLHLNPLFKIEDVIVLPELPKTASNKIMRRVLRERYLVSGKREI